MKKANIGVTFLVLLVLSLCSRIVAASDMPHVPAEVAELLQLYNEESDMSTADDSLDLQVVVPEEEDVALDEADARIAQLEQLLADRDAIIIQLADHVTEADVEALEKENKELSEALERAISERDWLRENYDSNLTRDAMLPLTSAGPISQDDVALRERLEQLELRLVALNAALGDVSAERDALVMQAERGNEQDPLGHLESDVLEMRERLDRLQSSLDSSESTRISLEGVLASEREMFDEQLQSALDEKEVLVTALTESESMRAELETALAKERTEDAKKLEALEMMREEGAAKRVKLDELMAELGDVRDAKDILVFENTLLQESLEALEENLNSHEAYLAERDGQIAILHEKHNAKQEELIETREEVRSQVEDMAILREQLRAMEEAYSVREDAIVMLEEMQADVETELADALATITELETNLHSKEGRLQQKQETLETLAHVTERKNEYEVLVDRLVPEVRALEEKLTTAMREQEWVKSQLLLREDEIATLHIELEKRDHRLLRVERVAEVIEQTRIEIEASRR